MHGPCIRRNTGAFCHFPLILFFPSCIPSNLKLSWYWCSRHFINRHSLHLYVCHCDSRHVIIWLMLPNLYYCFHAARFFQLHNFIVPDSDWFDLCLIAVKVSLMIIKSNVSKVVVVIQCSEFKILIVVRVYRIWIVLTGDCGRHFFTKVTRSVVPWLCGRGFSYEHVISVLRLFILIARG